MFPHLMNYNPNNINAKMLRKIPTIPTIPPLINQSHVQWTVVQNYSDRTINYSSKKWKNKTHPTTSVKKEPPNARLNKTTTQSTTIVKKVAKISKPSQTMQSMRDLERQKTTGTTVLAAHESSELQFLQENQLLTKEEFGWNLDLTSSQW